MKKISIITFIIGLFTTSLFSQTRLINAQEIESIITKPRGDTILVVNFWATWCKPCVEEMPYFQSAMESRSAKPVKFIIISCNSKKELTTVNQFLKLKKYTIESYLITEPDPNKWVDKISPEWSGAMPATLIIHQEKNLKDLYENEFPEKELNTMLAKYGL